MEADDGQDEEGPLFAWIPPDDRLWRHPSEGLSTPAGGPPPPRSTLQLGAWRIPHGRTFGVAVVAGVVGALLASSVGMMTGSFEHRTTVVQPVRVMSPNTVSLADVAASPVNWPSIADSLAPSVVAITSSGQGGPLTGSGVLYLDGPTRTYILTDEQLVGSPQGVKVQFDDGTVETGHLLRDDPKTGLALLWVAGGGRTIPTFGSISDVRVADTVMAIGAGGPGGGAVAQATVSGINRKVILQDGSGRLAMVALTAASMPPQTAGGPLVDQQGAIVGITTRATSSDPEQQQFAYSVPIDVAEHVASDIQNGHSPTHPWLGLDRVSDLSSAAARNLGLAGGVEVDGLASRSPAAAVGVAPGDIITAFEGQPVTSTGTLTQVLSRCEPGQQDQLSYLHKGKPVTVTITVSEQRNVGDD